MKKKKSITLGTVVASSVCAVIWIVVAVYHSRILGNTAALALMIAFAAAWSFGSVIQIVKYLKQKTGSVNFDLQI